MTPVTHSLPTLTGNAVSMIAAGNTAVFNPHPSGRRVAAEGVRRYNEAIYRDLGLDNLLCVITEPTIESANALFQHRDINLICVTGGPGVARAAMQQAKRAIVAGPGNPPVVVDETADLDRAARSIIQGGAYDNNLLCIAEKQVFAVESIFDRLLAAMDRAGAVRLQSAEIHALEKWRSCPSARAPKSTTRRARTSSARTPPCWPERSARACGRRPSCSSAKPTSRARSCRSNK